MIEKKLSNKNGVQAIQFHKRNAGNKGDRANEGEKWILMRTTIHDIQQKSETREGGKVNPLI